MSDKGLREYILNTISKDKWERLTVKKRAGVVVPLFSVYSRNSVGIGEFDDIRLLIDWCGNTGNSIIQMLPLNEDGAVFCPYDSISSFALEPAYISLRLLSGAEKEFVKGRIEKLKELFPAGAAFVNYGIKQGKINLLWDIFNGMEKYKTLSQPLKLHKEVLNLPTKLADEVSCAQDFRENENLSKFTKDNAYWLWDFALYKTLKNYYQGKAWYEWPDVYKNRDKHELEKFSNSHEKEIKFHIWVQWQLYEQFRDVKRYAESKQVFIKGDMPILVSRDSADVWAHPEFFKLEFSAGAPPDMYCAKGQRWGMPTYNWGKIEADGYKYLKEKLKYAENFYDILRIDHVVGLFRIWSIPFNEPLEHQGLHGFFDPHEEYKWKEHGSKILSIIVHNTKMLLCAEDLGIIPKVCHDTLKELGIPGNDVQRWVKDWNVRHDFLAPEEYRALSVAMLSTQDTTNWPAWWENEAGTVDEALFIRKCAERKIDYNYAKDKLFDPNCSRRGRLRWLNSITSVDVFVSILGKRAEEIGDFIGMYKNTYHEKEKLWEHLKLSGPMREKCDEEIVRAVFKITLGSSAVFCIELIIDWLYLAGVFKGNPYQYRFNIPGTVSDKNWSLTIPLSLEELLKHKVNQEIKELIVDSGR